MLNSSMLPGEVRQVAKEGIEDASIYFVIDNLIEDTLGVAVP
jgi:hypothetical protein